MSINGRGFLVSEQVDLDRPSDARVYDWYLGGCANWSVDRRFGERAVTIFPHAKQLAVANRRWLGRVVGAALDAGVTQFLDLGSGIPSMGAVHEWVASHPSTRGGRRAVVYVDNEPVTYAHIEVHLGRIEGLSRWVVPIQDDLCAPGSIFSESKVRDQFELDEPVCVLMVAVLHFVGGNVVPDLLADYRNRVASGSWLAVSHIAHDAVTNSAEKAQVEDFVAHYYKESQNPLFLRNRAEIETWMGTWGEALEPGVVPIPAWPIGDAGDRPDEQTVGPFAWCGVAVK